MHELHDDAIIALCDTLQQQIQPLCKIALAILHAYLDPDSNNMTDIKRT